MRLNFQGEKTSSSRTYLSESRLNCLGLSFFLSSVKLFNKSAKFFILDDVISSFDKHHRLKFANLLIEQFDDYQILLLTHEKEWFNHIAPLVKKKNWQIQETKWRKDRGIEIEIPLISLKQKN